MGAVQKKDLAESREMGTGHTALDGKWFVTVTLPGNLGSQSEGHR